MLRSLLTVNRVVNQTLVNQLLVIKLMIGYHYSQPIIKPRWPRTAMATAFLLKQQSTVTILCQQHPSVSFSHTPPIHHSGKHKRRRGGRQWHATICSVQSFLSALYYCRQVANTQSQTHLMWAARSRHCVKWVIQSTARYLSLASCRTDVRMLLTIFHLPLRLRQLLNSTDIKAVEYLPTCQWWANLNRDSI